MGAITPIFCSLLTCVFGWVVVAPLAALVPKRRDWVAVIGRQGGCLLDNAKYFFLQAGSDPGIRIVFVTQREDVRASVIAGGREAFRFPTFESIWFLIRCGSVIVDESAWFRQTRYFLLIRAKVIQLWHGIPFKRIELEHWRHEAGRYKWASQPSLLRLRLITYRVTGRWIRYAAVVATSSYYRDNAFARAFLAHHFPVTGYPRDDFGQSLQGKDRDLAWSNVDSVVKSNLSQWRSLNRKLVLVAPTFRDSGSVPMQLNAAALLAIDTFAAANGVEFLFKFHPSERNADHMSGRHFHVCARDSDVYPVLPHTAALVTDYSSISMDYLLLNRPLLFLIPGGDDYASNSRELQFDPRTIMPGPVVSDWPSLLRSLRATLTFDAHVQERAELRRKAFDDLPQAEAVPKLIALMREQGWLAASPMHRRP